MRKSLMALCGIVAVLSGCSSQPRLVKADIPLVEKNNLIIGTPISDSYRHTLEQPNSVSLSHPNYQIQLGPIYTSSLGQDCRELSIRMSNDTRSQRVVCAQKQQNKNQARTWYLVPNIIQPSASIQL